jgi:hypothetical protein
MLGFNAESDDFPLVSFRELIMVIIAWQVWNLNLPYSEYWLPLSMGMGVGFMFLVVARTYFGRREMTIPPPPVVKSTQEYDPFTHGSPSDKRKAFRRGGNPVEVFYALPDKKNDPQIGWVFDRSVGGLGMVTSQELAPETFLVVKPFNAPESSLWVDIEVRSCRETEDGFELGCKFVKTPPWSVLLMFG